MYYITVEQEKVWARENTMDKKTAKQDRSGWTTGDAESEQGNE